LVAHATMSMVHEPMPNASDVRAHELRRLMQRLVRRFGALSSEATPCGKPLSMAHAHALMVLLGKGELSQQELGAELCIDKSNIARLCARMVEAQHVVQQPSESDGRSRRISLTARGKRLAREVDVASAARFGAVLHGLGEARHVEVIQALKHLVAAVETLPT